MTNLGEDPEERDAAGELASGLVGQIADKIGAQIMDAVFPEQVPGYFKEVYAQIHDIIRQEIEQSTIDQIDGALNNIIEYMNNTYAPARATAKLSTREGRNELKQKLDHVEQTYLSGPAGMLGTLREDRYANAGLPVFLIAASQHLAILQEQALVDPYNHDDKGVYNRPPSESSYGLPQTGTVARTAKEYADFADKTWTTMRDTRQQHISSGFQDPGSYSEKYWFANIWDKDSDTGVINFVTADVALTVWRTISYYMNQPPRMSDPIVSTTKYRIQDETVGGAYNWRTQRTIWDDQGNQVFQGIADQWVDNPFAQPLLSALEEAYRNLRHDQIYAAAGKPEPVIAKWRLLIDTPIPSAPKTAPTFNPGEWGGSASDDHQRWKPGYKVRYAVSFYYPSHQQSPQGPWWSPQEWPGADTDGYYGERWAFPQLTHIPTDPSGQATGRVIYRQFKGGNVEVVEVIADNTATTFQDMADVPGYGPPAIAPDFDHGNWTGGVPVAGSSKWVSGGYKIRYAVSYYTADSETLMGPWWQPTYWHGADSDGYWYEDKYAFPTLINIPVDQTQTAIGRRIYRQFSGSPVELAAEIANNTDTRYTDTKP